MNRWLLVAGAPVALAWTVGGSGQAPVPAGRVSGAVLTTDEAPRPVRSAMVSLWGGPHHLGHHAVTDDEGRFDITGVLPGRYTLSAARAPYVTIPYGASRPGWPGTPLAIAAGQHVTGVRMLLARGAVITGTIRGTDGDPLSDLEVRVQRLGDRAPSGSAARVVRTDDQGVYRAFGLAAGTYVVAARPPRTSSETTISRTDAEVDAVLQRLRQRGPAPVASQPAARAAPAEVRHASDFVPVYFPGEFDEEDAMTVAVRAGEERGGIDITVKLMTASLVTGRVVAEDGRPLEGVEVTLARASARRVVPPVSTRTQPDGTFRFSSATPGAYRVAARSLPAEAWRGLLRTPLGGDGSPGLPGTCHSGVADVFVTGAGSSDVTLSLRPCPIIEGRVSFHGEAGAFPEPRGGIRVTLEPDRSSDPLGVVPLRLPAISTSDGRFMLGEFGDVWPGRYLVRVEATGVLLAVGWSLQAVTVEGQDVLDEPLEVTAAMPPAVRMDVRFTRERSSLSGRLESADTRPAPGLTVIAFPTNRDWWRAPYRRVLTTRSATDGVYRFPDVPPGEYFLAVVTEGGPEEWRDAVFLEELVRGAVRLTLEPGDAKVQNLRIGGGEAGVPRIGSRLATASSWRPPEKRR